MFHMYTISCTVKHAGRCTLLGTLLGTLLCTLLGTLLGTLLVGAIKGAFTTSTGCVQDRTSVAKQYRYLLIVDYLLV